MPIGARRQGESDEGATVVRVREPVDLSRGVRRALLVAATLAAGALVAAPGAHGATAWKSCSKAQGDVVARQAGLSAALNRDLGLRGAFGKEKPSTVYKKPTTSLCGDFDGDGDVDRALHYQCCTVAAPAPWLVLRRQGTSWQIAYSRLHDTTFKLAGKGTRLETTEPKYADSDANCCPSNLRIGILRWTGTLFKRTLRIVAAPSP
jgi:hypothetical protein